MTTQTMSEIADMLVLRKNNFNNSNMLLTETSEKKKLLREWLFDFSYITYDAYIKDEIEESFIDKFYNDRIAAGNEGEFKTQVKLHFRKYHRSWHKMFTIELTDVDYTLNVEYTETEKIDEKGLEKMVRGIIENEKTNGAADTTRADNTKQVTNIKDNATSSDNSTTDGKNAEYQTPATHTSWENATDGQYIASANRDTSTTKTDGTTNRISDTDAEQSVDTNETRINEEERDRTSDTDENRDSERSSIRTRTVKGNQGVMTTADIIDKSIRFAMFSTLARILDDAQILFVGILK